MNSKKFISVRGAREHNLKNIFLQIPRDTLVVMTGLSGSGKSSLAFDTIYAEGQRRYVESLSAYARQFLETMRKPDVDSLEGLSPAISIDQKSRSRTPRSTVGTVTEIHDYLRLLFARAGVPHSPATGLPISSQTITHMVDKTLQLEKGTRFYLLAPVVRARKGEYRREIAELAKRGFRRLKVDGQFYEIEDFPSLDRNFKHDIDVVVDRLVSGAPNIKGRLVDSFEIALALADGLAVIEEAQGGKKTLFSQRFACPVSGFSIEEIEPRLFSFNSPQGSCPDCQGLGQRRFIDPSLVVPDVSVSLQDGAVAPFSAYTSRILERLADHYGFSLNTPWRGLPKKFQNIILYGSKQERIKLPFMRGRWRTRPFRGVIKTLERRYLETQSAFAREEIEKYQSIQPCPTCQGYRLNEQALCVKLDTLHIGEVAQMSVRESAKWFAKLPSRLDRKQKQIATGLLREIQGRLRFLKDVGLDYLTLSRNASTLSGGESQRIRLASQIGSGLTGVLYVLDEPSIGLHQRDNARLLQTLQHLRDLGNTVIVVEHDEEAIRTADHLIDIGPGAGIHGGKVVAQGSLRKITSTPQSVTGQYLAGTKTIPVPPTRRPPSSERELRLLNASGHNLKNLDVSFPLGLFICLTGVSGSGKSTLLLETLYKALARKLFASRTHPAPHKDLIGSEHLDKIVNIDQSPIGRTPRSNPSTYTGAFTPMRDWFAALPESKARGYKVGRFSFNVKGGRCEDCQGDGILRIEMHFLPDIYVQCESCKGKRYNRETLEVTFKDKNIADVLAMTVEEACDFFKNIPAIFAKLEMLRRVGLDYITLGQSATTLSGGEAQRVKLAKELSRRATGRTFYILDEPTTGLHFHDVSKLLQVLQTLVDTGNTVVVVEHNLDVIKTADWVIDLGPEGGDRGGELVACGTPETLARSQSHTGRALRKILKKR